MKTQILEKIGKISFTFRRRLRAALHSSKEVETVDVSMLIPSKIAREIPALGLRIEDKNLIVALPEEFSDSETQEALQTIADELDMKVQAASAPMAYIREAVELVYDGFTTEHFTAPSNLNSRSEGPIIDLVNRFLQAAVKLRASDVHIEPLEKDVSIRLRIDGKLEELVRLPATYATSIVSRLKVLAKVSIVEKRKPQDGQFAIRIEERDIDVRLSTVSTLFGEKAALRILDTRRFLGDLKTLGMPEKKLDDFTRILRGHHGLIIAAGPTGSGKTTTMHSALQIVNSPDINVCTIEDPVEYVVPGVNHIPVNEQAGLSFATQLRALVRQDPDIILVGEIRDAETARIAVQAALAGRLVLTTLHAPDATGAIYRLFQMGVEPYQVAASLVGVVSQRLLRKNCPYCSEPAEHNTAMRTLISEHSGGRRLTLREGKGCTLCRKTGFIDRIGAFQLLEINEALRESISQRPSPSQFTALAKKHGLTSLQEEAFSLVASGQTSVNEILGLDNDAEA